MSKPTKSTRNALQEACYSCQTQRSKEAQHSTTQINLLQRNNNYFSLQLSLLVPCSCAVLALTRQHKNCHRYDSKLFRLRTALKMTGYGKNFQQKHWLTHVKHGIHKHRSIRVREVTVNVPSRYLTASDDRHLQHAPSELKFLLSWGTHQCSAKQLSTHHQLGTALAFSSLHGLKLALWAF